jgi:phage terminase large subunit-like protein
MDQFVLDGFMPAPEPVIGRPRKWETERARRDAENEKRQARRAIDRRAQVIAGVTQDADPADEAAQTEIQKKISVALTRAGLVESPRNIRDADLLELAVRWPNVAEGFQYALDVRDGVIDVCQYVRQACERHAQDLMESERDDYPYIFDPRCAERALHAMQKFREIKGPRAGKRLRLMPWQLFIYASALGWVDKITGHRRFRYVFVAVPRGNGKSTGAAPLALYMLALDREGGAEVYAAAVTREQARIVFVMAQNMVKRDREFQSKYGVTTNRNIIAQESSASMFTPLSRDADALDGKNVHFAVLDELAKHKTREVHDVLITATGKRAQAMILAITTAASNQSGIGYEQWKYTQRVLAGDITDERYFGIIYTMDEGDDWRDPQAWRKANPNWGVSVEPEVIATLAERAQNVASLQNAFKQKHLNMWTSASVVWMEMQRWHACADPTLKSEQFTHEECIVGMDLAAKIDLAAVVKLFRRTIDEVEHYYMFANFYLPQSTIETSDNASYHRWANEGWITACAGETIDQQKIEDDVTADAAAFDVLDVTYDPWQALNMASRLDAKGIPCIEYRPTLANFTMPMKELEALVRQGRFHHAANPVMDWCIACTEAWVNSNGDMRPVKDKNNKVQKIDGTVALLMAMGRRLVLDADGKGHSTLHIL